MNRLMCTIMLVIVMVFVFGAGYTAGAAFVVSNMKFNEAKSVMAQGDS